MFSSCVLGIGLKRNRESRGKLNDDTFQMVYFMLDNLGSPAGEGFDAGLEPVILVLHLDGVVTLGFPGSGEGKTSFLRFVGAGFFKNYRVKQD